MRRWTFFIATFGCKVNQYETQALREAWRALGGRELASPSGADAALVNSCAVTARAERDARNALYRLRREAPSARRLLTGCAARPAGEALAGTGCLHALIPQENKSLLLQGPWADFSPAPDSLPLFRITDYERSRPVLKVQDGCSRCCAFCMVPQARGPSRSRDPLSVCAEAERLLAAGFREIVISGINLSGYGRDLPAAPNFWGLLRMLEERLAPRWAGAARLRVSSLDPGQLDEQGMEHLARSDLLCPHLHLSLQSGSPEILRRMGRGHTDPVRLVEAVRRLRAARPLLGLGADMLAGFPGEKDSHVRESLHIMRELDLTYAHVFPYSRRPGTAAALMPEQVPKEEKLRRARLLRETAAAQRSRFLRVLLDEPVLFFHADGMNGGKGIDEHYAPCRLTAEMPRPGHELLPVRPLRVENGELTVAPA
jgi:MiaB/RimO family radical SAM methylthiotransferase